MNQLILVACLAVACLATPDCVCKSTNPAVPASWCKANSPCPSKTADCECIYSNCPCADCPPTGFSGACCHGNTTCETKNWSPTSCTPAFGTWCTRAAPTPPPKPTPPPAPTPAPPSNPTVDAINKRYNDGKPTNALAESGVIIHQFDDLEDPQKKWQPCSISEGSCQFKNPYDDRVSCSLLNADMPKCPGQRGCTQPDGSAGLFTYARGGVLVNASFSAPTCAYEGDGGTITRLGGGCGCNNDTSPAPPLTPGGKSPGPKCLEKLPCNNKCPCDASKYLKCHQCAFNATNQLTDMMHKQVSEDMIYNEILLGSTKWKASLPDSIMGFFYPSSCGKPCQLEVEGVYKQFMAAYPKSKAPLLRLNIAEHKSPFQLMKP